jgi:uncharacterized membrane protein YqgA involved in biofilm formation
MNAWGFLIVVGAFVTGAAVGRFIGITSAFEQFGRWAVETQRERENACPACNEVDTHAAGCPLAELAESE